MPLSTAVLNAIKSVFEDLSSENLLKRCSGAHTQKNNESLISGIGLLAPKHLHSGKSITEIATLLAIIIFNEGYTRILQTMSSMEITLGLDAEACASLCDIKRLDCS